MAWNPDNPFLTAESLGETGAGARNLSSYLCSLLPPGPLLALGSSEAALEAAESRHVTVVDWSSRRLAALDRVARERGVAIRGIVADPDREELCVPRRGFASALCLEGLERFRDDVGVLEKVHAALAAEGTLIARVPACLFVPPDTTRLLSTPRHHDPESLRALLEDAGFRTAKVRYWNFIGVPAAFLRQRVLGGRPAPRAALDEPSRFGVWCDAQLDLWYRTFERRLRFPTGVSLVAVGSTYVEKARVRGDIRDAARAGRNVRPALTPMSFRG